MKKLTKSELFYRLLEIDPTARIQGKKVFISTSGGRTSMYQCNRLLEEGFHLINEVIIVFANTGWEHYKTLDFVHNCFELWTKKYGVRCVWVEAKVYHGERRASGHTVVTYETASRNREPFEETVKKYGIPNNGFQWCTREMKENPIKSFILEDKGWSRGEYYTVLGMRSDELKRVIGQVVYDFAKKHRISIEDIMSMRKLAFRYRTNSETINKIRAGAKPRVVRMVSPYKSTPVESSYGRCMAPSLVKETTKAITPEESYITVMTRFINRVLRSRGITGIKYDELRTMVSRLMNVNDPQNKVYPLVDWFPDTPDKLDILDWWEDQEFDLGIEEWQGNCIGCYKKSQKKLLKVVRDSLDQFENTLEIDYGRVGPNKRNGKLVDEPRVMYRGGLTCQGLIALFKQTPPAYLRDHSDDEVEESGCSSSCEAFGGDN